MTPRLLFAIPLLLVGPPCLQGETLSIPLDLGEQPLYVDSQAAARFEFDAERELTGILDVRLQVAGDGIRERSICWNFGAFGAGTWSYLEDAGLILGLGEGGATVCTTEHRISVEVEAETGFALELRICEPVHWEGLSDGPGSS